MGQELIQNFTFANHSYPDSKISFSFFFRHLSLFICAFILYFFVKPLKILYWRNNEVGKEFALHSAIPSSINLWYHKWLKSSNS